MHSDASERQLYTKMLDGVSFCKILLGKGREQWNSCTICKSVFQVIERQKLSQNSPTVFHVSVREGQFLIDWDCELWVAAHSSFKLPYSPLGNNSAVWTYFGFHKKTDQQTVQMGIVYAHNWEVFQGFFKLTEHLHLHMKNIALYSKQQRVYFNSFLFSFLKYLFFYFC